MHQQVRAMDEKVGSCKVITGSTSCKIVKTESANATTKRSAAVEAFYHSMKERRKLIAASKPGDLRCTECGGLASPSWNDPEGRWEYPELTDNGMCRKCRKFDHISQNIETHLKNAGVPTKYVDCTFENFTVIDANSKVVNACKQYPVNHHPRFPGLYLYGNCGTGKTHLAAAITRELLLSGRQVIFTCVPGLCFEIKKAFEGTITEQDAIKKYTDCDCLVLDDFGVEKHTDWVKKTLNYIIYERDNAFKPIIFTSNLSLDEIADRVDKRISSRITGMGQVIRVLGPDWRLKRPVKLHPGTGGYPFAEA